MDPSKKGKGTMLLHDYMNQRDTLLTARYGDGGKGFFHERESQKKREKPFIEALLPPEPVAREVAPPTVPVKFQPRKKLPRSQKRKRPVRIIRKIIRDPPVKGPAPAEPKTED